MVVKWLLGALVALGLLVVAVATIEVGLAGNPATGIDEPRDPVQRGWAPSESNGASAGLSQAGQRRAGLPSWLLGLGLVVVLARLGDDGTGLDLF